MRKQQGNNHGVLVDDGHMYGSLPLRILNSRSALISLFVLLLFYATATVFQLYHGSDMMYEIRRKSDPTLLTT